MKIEHNDKLYVFGSRVDFLFKWEDVTPCSNMLRIIPSKLEVAPNALKMLDGVGERMDGYPLDCYDY